MYSFLQRQLQISLPDNYKPVKLDDKETYLLSTTSPSKLAQAVTLFPCDRG
jgi:hypothetical protein